MDRETFALYFFEVEGRPVFCPLLFRGWTFFVLMHTVFVKFSQLTPMKIIEIVAPGPDVRFQG